MEILAKNLLILASAGSGKTYQLGNRVIGRVANGAQPEKIVALTFTRKAAGEFADAVLTKLAESAASQNAADRLRNEIGIQDADFSIALETVVRALPQFTLGTIDSFFAKIVKGFQYELGLTGGRFDLLEGPRAAAAADAMLAAILGDALNRAQGDEFYHAFRRATIGREDQGVMQPLREFVAHWQELYREFHSAEWGPSNLTTVSPDEWANQKNALAAAAVGGLDAQEFTRKGQREALEQSIAQIENHIIGSGSLGNASTLTKNILQAVATQATTLRVKSYKEFDIIGTSADALRTLVELAAHCELAAALLRTRAVKEVVAMYDAHCAEKLRSHGLLGFSDVKFLMGEWSQSEDARLRREAVDFRLDSRIDHWLLDEFQDTSRADWKGLQPLIDEAATGDDGSVFIVGDRKQAIYAWRGGDVGLFQEVIDHYGEGIRIEPMDESFRSCPEVLALVNRVCGDLTTLHELFGTTASRWIWHDHQPAAHLRSPEKRGEARVEVVGDWDQRLERLVEMLHELEVGKRAMTCGILLRGNEKARQVSDHLRLHGFDVIEEGRRQPAKDNPVGAAIHHLMKWLADPADAFAREVLEMSPFSIALQTLHGPSWREIWESLTQQISRSGFTGAISPLLAACWETWSDFGRRRAGDLLSALAALDARGGISCAEAADWLNRLEVAQSPGVAAVQVMTIHKSKGLGFDLVVLPEIPADSVPQSQRFEIAAGPGWLSQTPAKWARDIIPEMRDAEARWAADQQYEALCMLYVALTRAKRGLYVLLDIPPKSSEPDKPSLANWIARSTSDSSEPGIAWQDGDSSWSTRLPLLDSAAPPQPLPASLPGHAVPRRPRMTPSGAKASSQAPPRPHSSAGMKFGSEVHQLLESIAWADEASPTLPNDAAGTAVASLLASPVLDPVFQRGGRKIDLFREQTIDAILDGGFLSGIIDRLHLHRDPAGSVTRIEIIDYKTDAVNDPAELAERYSAQMNAYRQAMRRIYPEAEIECLLLSVRHRACLRVTVKER